MDAIILRGSRVVGVLAVREGGGGAAPGKRQVPLLFSPKCCEWTKSGVYQNDRILSDIVSFDGLVTRIVFSPLVPVEVYGICAVRRLQLT